MWIGISPSVAVATDLFYNSVTKLFGSIQHVRQRTINMQLVKYLAIGSLPSAICAGAITTVISTSLGESGCYYKARARVRFDNRGIGYNF
jgi:uncharacterized membrane protein YfcA